MLQCTEKRRGSLSFYLGGKAPSNLKERIPDIKAVPATIKYAMTTGRLEMDDEEALDSIAVEQGKKTNTTQPIRVCHSR